MHSREDAKLVLFKASRLNLHFLSTQSSQGERTKQEISCIIHYLWRTKICGILYSGDSSITLPCQNLLMYSDDTFIYFIHAYIWVFIATFINRFRPVLNFFKTCVLFPLHLSVKHLKISEAEERNLHINLLRRNATIWISK